MDCQKDSDSLMERFGKLLALPGVPWARWWRKYREENGNRRSKHQKMNGTESAARNNYFPQKSLKRNAALNMTRTVMSLVFPLATFPYTSRVLGPVYIGRISFAQSVVSYFSLIAALGISSYAVRETARLRNDRTALSLFAKEIFFINMISTATSYCLFFISLALVPQFSGYKKLLCIISGTVLFTTLGMEWLYTGLEEFAYITVRSVAFQLISLVLLFAFVRTQDDYLRYAAIGVVSSAGSNVLNFIHARKFIDFRTRAKLLLRRHVKPVLTMFAMSAAVSIYTVLDTTMLGFLRGDGAVGLYTAATKINRVVVMMITAAIAVLLPRLSFCADRDRAEFRRLSNRAVQFVVLFSVPCAAGLFILAEPAVRVFSGTEFLPAVPAMKIMNAVVVLISVSGLIGTQILMALKKERVTLISVIMGAAVNFILNVVLIPRYDVRGAAVATVCAETAVTAIQIVCVRKLFEWKSICAHFAKVAASALVLSLCVLAVCRIFEHLMLKIVLGILLGIFCYALCMFLLKDELFVSLSMQVTHRFLRNNFNKEVN